MRTFALALAIIWTVGCDEIITPLEGHATAMSTTTTVEPAPAPWRLRWTTAHDGVAMTWAGVVSIVPDGGAAIDAIRVRLELAPRDGQIVVDGSAARIEAQGRSAIRPLAINAYGATLPVVIAEAGGRTTVDLWFANADVPGDSFVFAWPVTTRRGRAEVRALVQLEGTAVEQPAAVAHWWFSPTHAWATFRHHDGVITPQPPTAATLVDGKPESVDVDENPCAQW